MIPEVLNTQCAWCGSPMSVLKDHLELSLAETEGKAKPILICALCAEGNTIVCKQIDGGHMIWMSRTEPKEMATMKLALNSSAAGPYIKRRTN
jgi:hypothetical protein